jgi:hypothetical protein
MRTGDDTTRVATLAVAAVVAICAIVGAIALWRSASASDERACIERAEARYPAVPVSAFVPRNRGDTGPLRVSFVSERAKAVAAC